MVVRRLFAPFSTERTLCLVARRSGAPERVLPGRPSASRARPSTDFDFNTQSNLN